MTSSLWPLVVSSHSSPLLDPRLSCGPASWGLIQTCYVTPPATTFVPVEIQLLSKGQRMLYFSFLSDELHWDGS